MILQNSTTWPNWFLRRVVSWCAKQLELPHADIKASVFRNSRCAWGGCARGWRKAITVCVGKASYFPRTNRHGINLQDREDCLVWVTAHELAHIFQYLYVGAGTRQRGGRGGSEDITEKFAKPIVARFQQERATLLAEWLTPPATCLRAPQLSVVEKRAVKAKNDLAKWQRRLKLAQTKVRKLKTKVRYYERQENGNTNT